jgi:hypothetical protein
MHPFFLDDLPASIQQSDRKGGSLRRQPANEIIEKCFPLVKAWGEWYTNAVQRGMLFEL